MRIAISGAGIAGPTLAFWLLRGGHEPVLIEKMPHFRTGGYLVDFWGVGYTIAERMGILPTIREAGYPVEEVLFVGDRGEKVGGFSTESIRRLLNDRFTSLSRRDLALAIYQTIEGRVETVFGDSISAIDNCGNNLVLSFEHGTRRIFDLVIGADGQHSTVRKLVFGAESQFERPLGYGVAAFELEGYRPRDDLAYVTYSQPGKQVARFSLRDNRTMFLFVFTTDETTNSRPRDLHEQKRLLHRIFGDAGWECPRILQAMDQVSDIYFDKISQIRMPHWSNGRVMLIGDAAACASLLAGEGAGLAMTEAYVLAGELHRARGDYREAFRCCEQRVRPFVERKQESARKFASAFAPRTRFGVWFRNQVTKLLAIPAVANYFVGRDLQDHFELPNFWLDDKQL